MDIFALKSRRADFLKTGGADSGGRKFLKSIQPEDLKSGVPEDSALQTTGNMLSYNRKETMEEKMTVADIFSLSPDDLLDRFAAAPLKGMGAPVQEGNLFVYRAGNIPVLLVAHVDTVLPQPKKESVKVDARFMYSLDGHLGGDDRAGVLMILHILKIGLRPHVLFTNFEECGGMGADAAAKAIKPDVRFVIELDRMGEDDAVYYSCGNHEFKEFINSYGFQKQFGSFSDISILCPEWNIAGANLSTGYYRPHSNRDFVETSEYFATIKKVIRILKTGNLKAYDYGRIKKGAMQLWDDFDYYDFRMGTYGDTKTNPDADLWRTDPFYYSEKIDRVNFTDQPEKTLSKRARRRMRKAEARKQGKVFGTIGLGTIGKK